MLRALGRFLGNIMGPESAAVSDNDENSEPIVKRRAQSSMLSEPKTRHRSCKRAPVDELIDTFRFETPRKRKKGAEPRRVSIRAKAPLQRFSLTFNPRILKRRSSSIDPLVSKIVQLAEQLASYSEDDLEEEEAEKEEVKKEEKTEKSKKIPVKQRMKSVVETKRPRKAAQDEEELLPDGLVALKEETAPQLIVVCSDHAHTSSEKIRYMETFQATIPASCKEAIRGQKQGNLDIKYDFPGIPTKKFALNDMSKYGSSASDWPVQAIYDSGDDHLLVHYEGWTCQTMSWQQVRDFERTAPEMLRDSRIKTSFMKALRDKIPNGEAMDFVEHWAENKRKNPHHLYWLFEDLTYFHSVLNKESGLAPVFYMSCSKNTIKPPYFAYTPINIIECDALKMSLKKPGNKKFEELKKNNTHFFKTPVANCCENASQCKCDRLFGLLYAHPTVQYLKYRADATLDFPRNFNLDRRRLVMECSDDCGCSASCPRRALQRGQQHPLVVYYENSEKGFGLRAAAHIKNGSLVCEYTGEITVLPKKEWSAQSLQEAGISSRDAEKEEKKSEAPKDTSYEAGFSLLDDRLTICALTKGNVARFINHSCSPSTVFVEVYSRRSTDDPLIPRVAVYAIKDIEKGDEITVAYWSKKQMEEFATQRNHVSCRCGAAECHGYLRGK